MDSCSVLYVGLLCNASAKNPTAIWAVVNSWNMYIDIDVYVCVCEVYVSDVHVLSYESYDVLFNDTHIFIAYVYNTYI